MGQNAAFNCYCTACNIKESLYLDMNSTINQEPSGCCLLGEKQTLRTVSFTQITSSSLHIGPNGFPNFSLTGKNLYITTMYANCMHGFPGASPTFLVNSVFWCCDVMRRSKSAKEYTHEWKHTPYFPWKLHFSDDFLSFSHHCTKSSNLICFHIFLSLQKHPQWKIGSNLSLIRENL